MTKDRRKPHVRQEDEELAAALQAGALSESEAEGDPRAAAAAGGLPGDSSLLVLAGLASEREQFDMLVRTMRVMVGAGQASEALQLADHVNQLFSRRGAEKSAPHYNRTRCFVMPAYRNAPMQKRCNRHSGGPCLVHEFF